MKRLPKAIFLAAVLSTWVASFAPAHAQVMSARRLGMGGAPVPGCGPGADGVNVAYHSVPRPEHGCRAISLPIGVIPVLQDPPVLDPEDPDFNAFELANLLMNVPWNWSLDAPTAPSGDIGVSIGRNTLAVNLGDVGKVLPRDADEYAVVARLPVLAIGFRRMFVGVSPLVHAENSLALNSSLQSALIDAEPFQPTTHYEMTDDAIGQVAAQGMLGWAQPLWRSSPDPRRSRTGLYAGVRARLIRGLAYADAQSAAGFTTADTLFGDDAVDVDYHARLRTATPQQGGFGQGLDAGLVLVAGRTEIGLAANDLATRLRWKVRERLVAKDTLTGDLVETTVAEGVPYTSTIPATGQITVTTRLAGFLFAGAATRDALGRTTSCAGVERWLGPLALRAGVSRDLQNQTQTSGGVGLRLGRFGLDAAVATHSRNLTHERATELGAGFALYH